MGINELIKEQNITEHQLAGSSGVSQAVIRDLCSGKAKIKDCSGETLYKLSMALGVSVDSLLKEAMVKRPAFEIYKSNVCHLVKDMGDINFLLDVIKTGKIFNFLDKRWYREALYLLAMVDYLCRVNSLPLYEDYEELRRLKLSKLIYPSGVLTKSASLKSDEPKEKSLREAIPEFLRHNIVESEVRGAG